MYFVVTIQRDKSSFLIGVSIDIVEGHPVTYSESIHLATFRYTYVPLHGQLLSCLQVKLENTVASEN
jgi:hypothetical protein